MRGMERRCAGAVDALGVAGCEMGEDLLDECGNLDARDDAQRAATHATVFDVDVEDALEPLHPTHGHTTRRMRLAGGLMDRAVLSDTYRSEVSAPENVVPLRRRTRIH